MLFNSDVLLLYKLHLYNLHNEKYWENCVWGLAIMENTEKRHRKNSQKAKLVVIMFAAFSI